jgi:hypothetical protein
MATELPKGDALGGNGSELVDEDFEMCSHPQMGGTVTDGDDMRTLGRIQQLNVSTLCITSQLDIFH